MSPRTLALLLAGLVALPAAATLVGAHQAPPPTLDGQTVGPQTPSDIIPPANGYTGPGRTPYVNFFQGTWIYGEATATPIGDQLPLTMRGSGDWMVWEDQAKGDIFAYNVPAGTGQYVSTDAGLQRNPDISGNTIVWEDYRNNSRVDVYAYFLDTGEERLLSTGPGNHLTPRIDGNIVAWVDDRNKHLDIYGYNLTNRTEFPIYVGSDRESDPLVLGNHVYFRTYRFNVWDVMDVDLATMRARQLTSDLAIKSAPFTDGHDVLYLTEYLNAWRLDRYDPSTGAITPTKLHFQDTTPLQVEGNHLIDAVRSNLMRELVAENVSSGETQHVSGDLPLTTEPFLTNGTVYGAVKTVNGTDILAIRVSPFAYAQAPRLQINNPKNGMPWVGDVVVDGNLIGGGFTTPATFTYRVDDGAPQAIPSTDHFRFQLDPSGEDPGSHTVTIRATYREGPPVERSFSLLVPRASDTVDIQKAAQQFHAARVFAAVNTIFIQNPAIYFVILLALLVVAMLAVRVYYYVKPKRARVTIEYVSIDE
jgi:beta propeller repeat protein